MLRRNLFNALINRILFRFSSNESLQIVIPKRIKRDNLSILKALASTVKKDYTSPNYKYIDDPFFVPKNNFEKRVYSLSKISGQEAAQYINSEFPTSFEYDPAEPSIQSLLPSLALKHSENTLEGLQERIFMKNCLLAHESYLKCIDENIMIPDLVVEDLLDLLCFYNSQNPKEEIVPEKLFLQHSLLLDKKQPNIMRKTWKEELAAERVFKNLKNPSIRARCSIIQGRTKYCDMEGAYKEYLRMKEDKLVIDDVDTYNSTISTIAYVAFGPDEKWEKLNNILNSMKSDNVFPNVSTFNAVLRVLKTFKNQTVSKQMLQILSEMKKCGVEPSLSTWTLVLKIAYFHKNVESNILYKIVEYLSTKELHIHEPADYDFFYTAMDNALNNLKDLKLAYALNNMVSSSSHNLIGDGYRENLYYTNFFTVMTTYADLDELMEYYNQIVPNTYDPTFKVMDSIFNLIEIQEGYRYLPKIYSDMVTMNYIKNQDLLLRLLSIMAARKHPPQMQQILGKISENIMDLYEKEAADIRLRKKFELDGQHMGFMAIVFLNADNFESARKIIDIYLTHRKRINKFPSQKALAMLCEECLKQKFADKALALIKLMQDLGFASTENFLKRIEKEVTLTDEQLKLRQSILNV